MTTARNDLQIAFVLALLLFGTSCQRNVPQPLSKSATLEVYLVSRSNAANSRAVFDPGNGTQVFLILPPVIASADVATVQRAVDPNEKMSLTVRLTTGGSQKLSAATTPPAGKELAILVNGQVASVAKVVSPISTGFSVSGGLIGKDRDKIFAALIEK